MNDEPYLTRPPAALRMGRHTLLRRAGLVGASLAGLNLTGCALVYPIVLTSGSTELVA